MDRSTHFDFDEQEVTTETRWAVRWTPQAAFTETGTAPPWSVDYQRWLRSPSARVYQQTITTTISVSFSDWVETSDGGGSDD